MVFMTFIMVVAFICAAVEIVTQNYILGVMLLILASICWAGMAVVDEIKKQRDRNEELWSYLLEDLSKIRKAIKKKDAEDE